MTVSSDESSGRFTAMLKIPPMPELLQCEKCSAVVMGLTAVITAQREALHELQKEVETLREEIARLKKQKSKRRSSPRS